MASNAENALSIVVGLEHTRLGNGGGGLRRGPDDLIAEAEKYQAFLDGNEVIATAFVLTSKTYKAETNADDRDQIVGIYTTREGESYRDNAKGPVTDGVITEWCVESRIVGPDGKYLETGEE